MIASRTWLVSAPGQTCEWVDRELEGLIDRPMFPLLRPADT
ncbi:hypothetical protein AB0M97_03300 [Streptomyces sp. NPDC051207]